MEEKKLSYMEFLDSQDIYRQTVLKHLMKNPLSIKALAKAVGISSITCKAYIQDEKRISFPSYCKIVEWVNK